MEKNSKINQIKFILIPALVTFIIFFIIESNGIKRSNNEWLTSPSENPKEAILKYYSKEGFRCSEKDIDIKETNTVDKDYGKLFLVKGVSMRVKDDLLFFYVKYNDSEWNVVGAGTGP